MSAIANSFTKLLRFSVENAMGHARQELKTVAASETIKRFDIVKLSSGKVANAIADATLAADATAYASGGAVSIYGIALADGAAGATIPVLPFDDDVILTMRVYNSTASASQLQDLTEGTAYQFVRYRSTSSLNWYAVSTTTTNGELQYIRASGESAQDDTYGIGQFKVVRAYQAGVK